MPSTVAELVPETTIALLLSPLVVIVPLLVTLASPSVAVAITPFIGAGLYIAMPWVETLPETVTVALAPCAMTAPELLPVVVTSFTATFASPVFE